MTINPSATGDPAPFLPYSPTTAPYSPNGVSIPTVDGVCVPSLITTPIMPSVIRVCGIDVKLTMVDKLPDDDDWGLYSRAEIQINSNTPSRAHLVNTIMHEINHAIYDLAGLREGDDEERICTILAMSWTQILRDNPLFLNWMQKELTT